MLTHKSNFTELQWVIKMFTKLKKIRDFLSTYLTMKKGDKGKNLGSIVIPKARGV